MVTCEFALHLLHYLSFRGRLIWNRNKVIILVVAFGAADDDRTDPRTLIGPSWIFPSCVVWFSGSSHFSRFFLRHFLLISLKKKEKKKTGASFYFIQWFCACCTVLECEELVHVSCTSLSSSLAQQLSFLYLICDWGHLNQEIQDPLAQTLSLLVHKILHPYPGANLGLGRLGSCLGR